MDKKTLPLVILLVVVIIFYGQILDFLGLVEPVPQQIPVEPPVATHTTPAADSGYFGEQIVTDNTTGQVSGELMSETSVIVDSVPPDTIIINTNKYQATLSTQGGGTVSIILKEYSYRDGELIEMLPNATSVTPEATFAGDTFSTSKIRFSSNLGAGTYDATRDTVEIVFTYDNGMDGRIIKRMRFYPDTYHYDLTIDLEGTRNLGFERSYKMVWNTPLGVTEPQASIDYEEMQAITMQGGARETLDDFNDGRLNQSIEGSTPWVGVRAKYFAAVLMPQNREASSAFAQGLKRDVSTPDGSTEARYITAGMKMEFAGVENLSDSFRVFVGPLDYMLLDGYDAGLEDMLGIGTTPVVGWIIKPFAIAIMWVLPRMYNVIPNYGLVIILFALLVKIVTLPLSMKSFKSMQAMKELQPKVDELKVTHKKNPQALNKEMMQLYKKHGVSPVSGCLPMIPQMPLFFALFSVFRSTILLRDAPFVGFISDLSRGASSFTDPYIILVVIMIVAQFLSQKLTMPTTQSNKMMIYMMPLFMGFIFYKFAAGLVLYWICFSVFSLLDYVLFKRKKNAEVMAA